MGVVDAFMATWSKARATFGEGAPQDGSAFDASPTLLQWQSDVQRATPGDRWTGVGSDAYAVANEKQARVLGESAHLDRRLRTEVDRSAAVVAAGRRDLDAVRRWVADAAAAVPPTAQGERMLYPVVSKGSGEIAEILLRSNADMTAISGRIDAIGSEFQALGGDFVLGTGDHGGTGEQRDGTGGGDTKDGPEYLFGPDEPWVFPNDPPAPADSAPGGGSWDLGQGYPPGPGGGPPVGPFPTPQPWHRTVEPPVIAGTSGLQDVVVPPPNGWGEKPPIVLQEAYRFRVVGETFDNSEGHLRWVQRDGIWHQAQWVDYNVEAEHVRQATGNISVPFGFNEWKPIGIHDIYRLQVDNPRLTLYLPTPAGGVVELDPTRPGMSPSR